MSDEHPRALLERYFSDRLAAFYNVVRGLDPPIPVNDYAAPCLPYVGSAFCEASRSRRILFVGKATNGWDSLEEATGRNWAAADWLNDSEVFVLERVLPFYGGLPAGKDRYYQSSFWRRIYSLTCRVMALQPDLEYQRNPHRADGCFQTIAWTNLFKVGTRRGNPDARMVELLLEHLNSLPDEISMLQPRTVIFSTGSTYDGFISRSLGRLGATIERPLDRISVVSGLPGVGCALRIPHFQACTTEEFDEICRTVVRLASDK